MTIKRGKPAPQRPNLVLSLIGAYLCASLALAGAAAFVEGLSSGTFGWVRNIGASSLADRPIAFAFVAIAYLAAVAALGKASFVLIARLRAPRGPDPRP